MTSGRLWWPPVDDATVADCLRGLPGPHPGREFPFNAGPWRRWLADRHPAASAVVADLAGSGSVRRADLVKFAANADGADGLLRLFVATMIWGTGTGDNRGPWRTAEALRNSDAAVRMLANTRDLVLDGQPGTAYRTFRLPKVGPAFFTKWFWAVALPHSPTLVPLILDARVWASLGKLGWDSRTAAGTTDWGARYEAYLSACARWAVLAGLDGPEQVEQLLFDWAGGR